jgi:hypothetical protein
MKNFKSAGLVVLVALGAAGMAHGQLASVPVQGEDNIVPKEPMVPRLPGRVEYNVFFFHDFGPDWERSTKWRAGARAGAQKIEVVSISMDASTETSRIATKWSDGKIYTDWVYKGTQASPRSNDKGFYVVGTGAAGQDVGFSELGWLNTSNFRGVAKFGEAMVFVFRESIGIERGERKAKRERKVTQEPGDQVEPAAEEDLVAYQTTERVAYLDVKNQLPILSNDGQVIRLYTVLPTPTERLMPPPEMMEMLKNRYEVIQDRVALPGTPGG